MRSGFPRRRASPDLPRSGAHRHCHRRFEHGREHAAIGKRQFLGRPTHQPMSREVCAPGRRPSIHQLTVRRRQQQQGGKREYTSPLSISAVGRGARDSPPLALAPSDERSLTGRVASSGCCDESTYAAASISVAHRWSGTNLIAGASYGRASSVGASSYDPFRGSSSFESLGAAAAVLAGGIGTRRGRAGA